MANKITVMLEALGFDKASNDVKGFKQSVAEADGVTGKFKAGATSAFDSLKSAAGPAALGAGAALVAFGVKAVGAFTDTAKAAIDMGAATGLATEDASRWIAVGDDFGVAADQLEAGIGKIGKSLDSGKWEKYGVATRDAAGNARNANDVLIDSLDMLGKIDNETERARVGTELFGKGYANLAPIVGHTADEYRNMLGAVEDGQVITDAEAKKAEKMRLAQDALSDALGEVTLALGGMVAEMAPAIEQAAELVGWMTKLSGIHIPGLPEEFNLMTGQITYAQEAWKGLTGQIESQVGPGFQKMAQYAQSTKTELELFNGEVEKGPSVLDQYAAHQEQVNKTLEDMAAASQQAADAERSRIEAMHAAADATFALQEASDNFRDTVQALDDKVKEAKGDQEALNGVYREAAQDGIAVADATTRLAEEQAKQMGATLNAKDSLDLWNQSALAQATQLMGPSRDAILDYIANVNGIPPEKLSDIKAVLDTFGVEAAKIALDEASAARDAAIIADAETADAEAQLNNAARDRNVLFKGVPIFGSGRAFASGTPSAPPGGALVGERGPEFVEFRGGERVHTAAQTRLMARTAGPSIVMHNTITQMVDVDAMAQRLNFLLAS